jgi:hypothetical protein
MHDRDEALWAPSRDDYVAAVSGWRRASRDVTDLVLVVGGVGGSILLWRFGVAQSHPAWLVTFPMGWAGLLGARFVLRQRQRRRIRTFGLRCTNCETALVDPLDPRPAQHLLNTGACTRCGVQLFPREA